MEDETLEHTHWDQSIKEEKIWLLGYHQQSEAGDPGDPG